MERHFVNASEKHLSLNIFRLIPDPGPRSQWSDHSDQQCSAIVIGAFNRVGCYVQGTSKITFSGSVNRM